MALPPGVMATARRSGRSSAPRRSHARARLRCLEARRGRGAARSRDRRSPAPARRAVRRAARPRHGRPVADGSEQAVDDEWREAERELVGEECSRLGREPRARVRICCSPPESRPPRRFTRGRSSGNRSSALSAGPRPSRRFASAVRPMKTERSSVTRLRPRRALRCSGAWVGAPCHRTSPAIAGMAPASVRNVVDLPAPFTPSSTTTSPGRTSNERSCTTDTPPKPA